MTLEEFESGMRETLEQVLNQLQASNLLIVQLEGQLEQMGQVTQEMSRKVEDFVTQERNRDR